MPPSVLAGAPPGTWGPRYRPPRRAILKVQPSDSEEEYSYTDPFSDDDETTRSHRVTPMQAQDRPAPRDRRRRSRTRSWSPSTRRRQPDRLAPRGGRLLQKAANGSPKERDQDRDSRNKQKNHNSRKNSRKNSREEQRREEPTKDTENRSYRSPAKEHNQTTKYQFHWSTQEDRDMQDYRKEFCKPNKEDRPKDLKNQDNPLNLRLESRPEAKAIGIGKGKGVGNRSKVMQKYSQREQQPAANRDTLKFKDVEEHGQPPDDFDKPPEKVVSLLPRKVNDHKLQDQLHQSSKRVQENKSVIIPPWRWEMAPWRTTWPQSTSTSASKTTGTRA